MAQYHKAPTETPLQKFIKRMMKRWQDANVPQGYEGGVTYDTHSAIDDGNYGELRDEKPDFIKKDNDGWQTLDGH